jgi:TPR repeat protein
MAMDNSKINTSSTASSTLSPLYFAEKNRGTSYCPSSKNDDDIAACLELPPEILHKCLVQFADWGDLAKLACVQKSWSTILRDAAETNGYASKWALAQALLHGSNGLTANPKLAIGYLLELANVHVNEQDGLPMVDVVDDNEDNDNSSSSEDNQEHETQQPCCFAPAMREISTCYFHGAGVDKDCKKGLAWLEATHNLGHDMDAAHEVALLYEYGHFETEIDVFAAAAWFEKAAKSGHTEAMAELALCYELGCGVEQSDELALDWYMRAAEKGHLTAKFSVGEIFEEARGVPQSDEEACLWYYKAAVEGDEDSRRALRRLEDIARIVVPGVGRLLMD